MGYLEFTPSKLDIEMFAWCVGNGIRVYPKPVERGLQNKLYYICIEINKKETCSKDTFEKEEITEKIYEYYKYYYDKYKK